MKIGYFITARLKSSRLKKKILLDLNGISVLDHVINRCKLVDNIDGVVLCTSTNKQDAILNKYATKHKIDYFEGSEIDVLERLQDAALNFKYDAFISITADNPLHSYFIGKKLADHYRSNKPDFIFTYGLPVGIAPYFLSTKALQIAVAMKKDTETEIWGPFVKQPDFFNISEFIVKGSPYSEEKRLTCDYPQDYELIKTIIHNFDRGHYPDIYDIFNLFKVKPELWQINAECKQNTINQEILKTIHDNFKKTYKVGLYMAEKIGHKLTPGLNTLEINV